MSNEDEWLRCSEKLCECLREFRQVNVSLEKYINHTKVRDNIQDMQTSMENILHELEEQVHETGTTKDKV